MIFLMPAVAVPAIRAAVETRAHLPKRYDYSDFSSQLTKNEDTNKAALSSSNARILGLI